MSEAIVTIITSAMSIALPSLVALYVWNFKRKIEREEKDKKERALVENNTYKQNTGIVYRHINKLLLSLDCDRVEIVQPHPTSDRRWMSISYAVTSVGVNDTSKMFQDVEMKDVASFVGDLSTRQFICWKDVHDIKDAKVRSHFILSGNEMVMIYRLEDIDQKWIGNIFVSYLTTKRVNIDHIKATIIECAEAIQYILPDYKPYSTK